MKKTKVFQACCATLVQAAGNINADNFICMDSESTKKSQFLGQYLNFMRSNPGDSLITVPPEATLKKYRVKELGLGPMSKHRRPFSIRLAYVG